MSDQVSSDIIFISNEFMNLMIGFSDGIANTHQNATGYALAFWFFTFAIILSAKRIIQNGPCFETALLLIGCCFGAYRNGFMFLLDYGFYRGFFHRTNILASIPIVDHTIQMVTLLAINYVILYLSKVSKRIMCYYHLSFLLPFIFYCTIGYYWFYNLSENLSPNIKQYIYLLGEYSYHGIILTLSFISLFYLIKNRKVLHVSLLSFNLFVLTSQVYSIINTFTKGEYSDILVPYQNAYYLWSIPFIIYYIQLIPLHDQCVIYKQVVQEARNALRNKVEETN